MQYAITHYDDHTEIPPGVFGPYDTLEQANLKMFSIYNEWKDAKKEWRTTFRHNDTLFVFPNLYYQITEMAP